MYDKLILSFSPKISHFQGFHNLTTGVHTFPSIILTKYNFNISNVTLVKSICYKEKHKRTAINVSFKFRNPQKKPQVYFIGDMTPISLLCEIKNLDSEFNSFGK